MPYILKCLTVRTDILPVGGAVGENPYGPAHGGLPVRPAVAVVRLRDFYGSVPLPALWTPDEYPYATFTPTQKIYEKTLNIS